MATAFKLPTLGEGVDGGTIAQVLVAEGDVIKANQSVIEIETDKAVAEIPCSLGGKITEIKVKEGQNVKVGDVICIVDESAAGAAPTTEKAPAKAEEKPVESAPPEDKVVQFPPQAAEAPKTAANPAPAAAAVSGRHPGKVASPSVRQLARQHGVKLEDIFVADPSGRVTAQDVLNYVEGGATPATAPAAQPAVETPSAPATAPANLEEGRDDWGAVAVEPMSTIRKKTAQHMARSWTEIPHVTNFDQADITGLEAIRKKHSKEVSASGGKLTATSFILKILAEALKRFPKFNASVDMDGERLIYKHYYNIGVAVDTDNGLLVPVIRDVDQKSITQLALELPEIAEKARARKLALEDMRGGTFTVTNLGSIGGTGFTPIINAPELAILGIARARIEPVYHDGHFVPRTMLPLSLSYDHRIIDGADAARFLRWVVEALEQPWGLFLENV